LDIFKSNISQLGNNVNKIKIETLITNLFIQATAQQQ